MIQKNITYTKTVFRVVFMLLILLSRPFSTVAQGIEPIWEGRFLNHQTTTLPAKGEKSIYVVHYFASIADNGISDMFGIYGTANIQMGAEFGVADNTSVWFTSEKINKTQELGIRYKFVTQDPALDNPVGVAAAFSISVDGRDEKFFGANYYFIDRFFYTAQVAVSKQIIHRWEMMMNGTFAHLNIVPEGNYSTFFALNPSLAFKINHRKSLFVAMDFPLGIASVSETTPQNAKPLISFGTIIKTHSHNFQLFVSNANQISLAKEYLNNASGLALDNLCFGFNIHVKLGKKK